MREIVLPGVDERSAVYLGYDAQSAMARAGIAAPQARAYTLFDRNGVALMGRCVPGEIPVAVIAPHLRYQQ